MPRVRLQSDNSMLCSDESPEPPFIRSSYRHTSGSYRGTDKEDRTAGRWREAEDQVQDSVLTLPLHTLPR